MFKYDVSKELSSINIPTLILAANKDRLTRPDASKHMATQIPNAHLSTVAPANHQGLIERHAEVNKIAEHFIDELRN
jgi:pimeloyl-ACP methyl ester carboxylesterase